MKFHSMPCAGSGRQGETTWFSMPSPASVVSASVVWALIAAQASLAGDASKLALSPAGVAAAGIVVAPVEIHSLRATVAAPARIRYDDRRYVEVTVAASGIISAIGAKPGDAVQAGAMLALVISPEVAQARAEVLRRSANRDLAQLKDRRAAAVERGVSTLLAAVHARTSPEEIARQVEAVELGAYRQSILARYASARQAALLRTEASDPELASALPGREVQQRRISATTAQADLESVLDSAAYEAQLDALTAANELADAERQVAISRQYLAALLGNGGDERRAIGESQLAELEVRAPIAGTVQSRAFSASERVAPGDALFVVADTSTVWVEADIRDRQAGALALKPGDEVEVLVGGAGGKALPAQVHYAGGEVGVESHAVSLVAVLDNPRGDLRPGQFVEVAAPVGPERRCLAVPEAAIIEHEGRVFVFVETAPGEFSAVDVVVGLRSQEWVEVAAGLKSGERVVVAGAFALKSMQLLDQLQD
ncbi:MAG: efflux RND transporter periplasmic adaptor subunit [Pirellulales bacterium]|nr:efflux RND transporter periplasmic adaptor subunit [Pirellulales bacterium]